MHYKQLKNDSSPLAAALFRARDKFVNSILQDVGRHRYHESSSDAHHGPRALSRGSCSRLQDICVDGVGLSLSAYRTWHSLHADAVEAPDPDRPPRPVGNTGTLRRIKSLRALACRP